MDPYIDSFLFDTNITGHDKILPTIYFNSGGVVLPKIFLMRIFDETPFVEVEQAC